MTTRICLIVVLLLAAAPAAAEEAAAETAETAEQSDTTTDATSDELSAVPDRPTFSAGAAVVADGHAQLEAGGEFSSTDGASQIAFPILARIGVSKAFELRAGLPAIVVPLSDAETDLGAVQLGGKVAGDLTDSLSLGAMANFDIATSADDETVFSQSTLSMTGLWGYGLTDSLGIGGNVGLAMGPGSTAEAGPRELFTAVSLYVGYGFGDLGVTLEGFSVLGQYVDATAGGSLSLGYAVASNLILDAYGGASAQSGVTTAFGGLGVTYAR